MYEQKYAVTRIKIEKESASTWPAESTLDDGSQDMDEQKYAYIDVTPIEKQSTYTWLTQSTLDQDTYMYNKTIEDAKPGKIEVKGKRRKNKQGTESIKLQKV